MSEEVLYFVFVIVLLIAMLAYMNIKDKENTNKINKLERAIEELTKQSHFFRKDLENKADQEEFDFEMIEDEVLKMINQEISAKIAPVLGSLQKVECIIEEFQNEQQNRILNLEQKTQSMSKLSPNYDTEEQKVIDLFNQGKTIEQIAKDLRIGIGNVELVLKFNKLIN